MSRETVQVMLLLRLTLLYTICTDVYFFGTSRSLCSAESRTLVPVCVYPNRQAKNKKTSKDNDACLKVRPRYYYHYFPSKEKYLFEYSYTITLFSQLG